METSATSALAPVTTRATSSSDATNQLSTDEFFKLLVTELQQQDPLEPTKTADMISQVSQINSIEVSKQLTEVLAQLSSQQQSSGVSDLIGKYVEAEVTTSDGETAEIAGVVTGVRFGSDGAAVLELDTGDMLLASDVQRITSLENAGVSVAADSDEKDESTSKTSSTQKTSATAKKPTWLQLAQALNI